MFEPNALTFHRAFRTIEFRRIAMKRVLQILRILVLKAESRLRNYSTRLPTTLIRFQALGELKKEAETRLAELEKLAGNDLLFDNFEKVNVREAFQELKPTLEKLIDALAGAAIAELDRGGLLVLQAFNDLIDFERRYCDTVSIIDSEWSRATADDQHVYLFVQNSFLNELSSLQAATFDTQFVASVGLLIKKIRYAKRRPSFSESASIQTCYEVISKGTPVRTPYRNLGTAGFRKVQTLLFLTDPGEGHLRITCRDPEILSNPAAAVHIEHIDRESKNREEVEPYRIPAPINVAKIRLHVGDDAPCTAYIGRPVFENSCSLTNHMVDSGLSEEDVAKNRIEYVNCVKKRFVFDQLKSAHMTASSCTAMFINGVSECKIGIERMTARQAVDFLKFVLGNTFRDPHRQYLSAAFNLFTPLYDDLGTHPPVWADRPDQICKLGIRIASEAGVQKVTWDGARSGEFPSQPVLERKLEPFLSHKFWVELVHEAHLKGLITYVSGGLEPIHMPRAIFAGLDGIGIGVKLHDFSEESGLMGELDGSKMKRVLSVANQAQSSALGCAAKLLARLGRMHFEGILRPSDDAHRLQLYSLLTNFQPRSSNGLKESPTEAEEEAFITSLIQDSVDYAKQHNLASVSKNLAHVDEIVDDVPTHNPLDGQSHRFDWFQKLNAGLQGNQRNGISDQLDLADFEKLTGGS